MQLSSGRFNSVPERRVHDVIYAYIHTPIYLDTCIGLVGHFTWFLASLSICVFFSRCVQACIVNRYCSTGVVIIRAGVSVMPCLLVEMLISERGGELVSY